MNFNILEFNPKNIVVGVEFNPENPQLDAAKYPGFTGEETKISITRGSTRDYTIFYQDRDPYVFTYDRDGLNYAPERMHQLRKAITSYLASYGINAARRDPSVSNTLKYIHFPHEDLDKPHSVHLGGEYLSTYTRKEFEDLFQDLIFDYSESVSSGTIIEHYTFTPRTFTKEVKVSHIQPKAASLIKDYLTWYNHEITIESLGYAEQITTPYKNPLNDRIRIYIEPQDNGFIKLSDDGSTLYELLGMRVDTQTDVNRRVINEITYQYRLTLNDDDDTLSIITNKLNFPQAKLNLIQGILEIYALANKP